MARVARYQAYQDQATFLSVVGDANDSNKRIMSRLGVKQVCAYNTSHAPRIARPHDVLCNA